MAFQFCSAASPIRPGLWLGSAENEGNLQDLMDKGITHVAQIGKELRPSHAHLVYNRISIEDNEHEDLIKHLPKALTFIDAALSQGAKVLVHCFAGMSRSASVVIAYLAVKEGLSYDAAYRSVRNARQCICPNLGFVFQLQDLVANGCNADSWGGWNKHKFAERLRNYRLAQSHDTPGLRSRIRMRRQTLEEEERAAGGMAPPQQTATVGAA